MLLILESFNTDIKSDLAIEKKRGMPRDCKLKEKIQEVSCILERIDTCIEKKRAKEIIEG